MEWTRGPTIGRGGTATVSVAATTSGELFAVKSADLSRSGFLQREQHFLSQQSSPHIVKYMGFQVTRESNKQPVYNLFMEYVPGGTLSDASKRRGGSFDESTIRIYTHQILQGLNYLHLNGLVHCDIKSQNVLMGKDGLKIADLGCARLVEDGGAVAFSGTPVFMAPEVARGEEQGFPADVWALGCTVIEMATGANPWPEVKDPLSALYRIGFSGDVPGFPSWLSENAKDFLRKCLRRDSKERWTAKQLLQHPFFALNSEKSEELAMNSPTDVLNQYFWDSMEAQREDAQNPTLIGSSSNSPAEERIKSLMGSTSSLSGSNLPNWTWEEEWKTVRRSSSFEQTIEFSKQNCKRNPGDEQSIATEYVFSGVNLEEHGHVIVNEDMFTECFSVYSVSIIESFCVGVHFVTSCETSTHVFCSENSPFSEEKKVNKTSVIVEFTNLYLDQKFTK